jgi:hypothetical protein
MLNLNRRDVKNFLLLCFKCERYAKINDCNISKLRFLFGEGVVFNKKELSNTVVLYIFVICDKCDLNTITT